MSDFNVLVLEDSHRRAALVFADRVVRASIVGSRAVHVDVHRPRFAFAAVLLRGSVRLFRISRGTGTGGSG